MSDFERLTDAALEGAAGGADETIYTIAKDDAFVTGNTRYVANESYSGEDGEHTISTKKYLVTFLNGTTLQDSNCPMKVSVLAGYDFIDHPIC